MTLTLSAIIGWLIVGLIIGAGHVIITFIVALIVSAVLIAVVSHPRSRVGYRRRRGILR